jgi:hypothetical protein
VVVVVVVGEVSGELSFVRSQCKSEYSANRERRRQFSHILQLWYKPLILDS